MDSSGTPEHERYRRDRSSNRSNTRACPKRRSQGRIIFDRFLSNRSAIVGAIFLILLIVTCFLGPLHYWSQ